MYEEILGEVRDVTCDRTFIHYGHCMN